jgi:hypothetical protein
LDEEERKVIKEGFEVKHFERKNMGQTYIYILKNIKSDSYEVEDPSEVKEEPKKIRREDLGMEMMKSAEKLKKLV